MIRSYTEWVKDFCNGVIEYYESEGPCDFTCELQEYFLEIGFSKEQAEILTQSIAILVVEDLKEEFQKREYKAFIRPYTYPYPEVQILRARFKVKNE